MMSSFTPSVPAFGRTIRGIAIAAFAGATFMGTAWAKGPESLADLAAQVTPAVVNISASTTTPDTSRPRTGPQQPGQPFEDLFEEFFRRRGGQPPQGQRDEPPRQRRSSSLGSGFIIDPSGIVVTNNHVIGEANDIQVILSDGTRLKAEIIGKDAKVDLAVLRVKPDKP